MRNVSNQFLKAMKERRDFYAVAEITFSDGTKKTLEKSDFVITGNSVIDSAGTSSFPLGILAAKYITISLVNDDDRWSGYDFYGAKIRLFTRFELGEFNKNLVQDGDIEITTSAYEMHKYDLTEEIELDETYTITIWGSLGEGKTQFGAYCYNGYNPLVRPQKLRDGVYSGTFTIHAWGSDTHPPLDKTKLVIYALPNSVLGVLSTISKIKLEHGRVDNPEYSTESLNIGEFTVISPESYGETIEITAMDDSYKTDVEYSTGLTFPTTVGAALRDSCQRCGITLLTTTFDNDDYIIQSAPSNLTHRQFIGLCAMIAGGNARMDEYNRLKIMSYDLSGFENVEAWDGGTFNPWTNGEDIDGGSFNPWTHGESADGGTFGDRDNIHFLYKFKSGIKIDVDDVVITGVQIVDDDKNVHLYGSEGYVLSLENQLATGKEDEAVTRIGQAIVGLRFRPFSGDHISLPTAEFMDLAVIIDRKNNTYRTVLTDVDFTYFGFTTLKCSADSPIRNSSTYAGSATKAIVEARRNTEQQLNDYDRAVQMMTSIIANSFGMFETVVTTENGGKIVYQHDKPTLEESIIIWEKTEQGFRVSTDGGKTWNAGMTADGNAVVNVLSAIGIQAEWLRVDDLQAIGATIGGWGISSTQIRKYIDLYPDMTASGLSGLSDSDPVQYWVWMRSPVDSTTPVFFVGYKSKYNYLNGIDSITPYFRARTDGSVTASNISITGGSININTNNKDYNAIILNSTYVNSYLSGLTPSNTRFIDGQGGGFRMVSITGAGLMGGTVSACSMDSTYNDIGLSFQLDNSGKCYAHIDGTLGVTGTKSRIVDTRSFGNVLQYCYETPSPMFGDIGTGKTDSAGICYIYFDPVFAETVSTDCAYQVFLQKEGAGDIWIEEKNQEYFVVKGTPNLAFSWEAKAKQRDYEYERLEVFDDGKSEETDTDYAALADSYLSQFEKEIFDYESIDEFYSA